MSESLEFFVRAVLIGAGATVVLDLWALLLKCAFDIGSLDYALVGRWIGNFPRGRFVHDNIAAAAPVAGEGVIGWSAHYLIGIAYAALLLAVAGTAWARQPTLLPALLAGWITMIAPFFVMQPGLGAGVLASRTPRPWTARMRTLLAHTVFGAGLYLAALFAAALMQGNT